MTPTADDLQFHLLDDFLLTEGNEVTQRSALVLCPYRLLAHRAAKKLFPFFPIPGPLLDFPLVFCLLQSFFRSASLLFPSGVQWMATFAMLSVSLRSICPTSPSSFLSLVFISLISSSSFLEIVLGQNIREITRRHIVWNIDNLLKIGLRHMPDPEPYKQGWQDTNYKFASLFSCCTALTSRGLSFD